MKYVIKLPPEQPIDRFGGNFIINIQTLVHVKILLCMILFRTKKQMFDTDPDDMYIHDLPFTNTAFGVTKTQSFLISRSLA